MPLALRDVTEGREGGGLGGSCVEEVVVAATESSELEHDRATTRTGSSNRDVLSVATKLMDVLLHPLQQHPLVLKPIIQTQRLVGFDLPAG